MNNSAAQYTGRDLAFLIPSKDRPDKLKNLLESIAKQNVPCGRILVIASGQKLKNEVLEFSNRLPVEYFHSEVCGQIHQRNIGIKLLDEATKLVSTLDDDIILESDALEKMIDFWNSIELETAGVGFNITNAHGFRYSRKRHFLGISGTKPGMILKSGYSTPVTNVLHSTRTDWLNGGSTVWKQAILKNNPHKAINARWAVCEDLIFSYPIGKKYPLYIAANAKVTHDHCFVPINDMSVNRYQGKTLSLWQLFFAHSNDDLSVPAYLRQTLISSLGALLRGVLVTHKWSIVEQNIGRLEGLFLGLITLLRKKELTSVLEDK
jgi:glycosyltransferase involved in cell wall biosynthesis